MRLGLGSAAPLRRRAADPARLFYARPPRAQDRFGRPRERLSKDTAAQPGPGAYDVLGAPDRQGKHTFGAREEAAPLPSATFLSATGRERHAGGGAPLRRCPCLACAVLRSAPLPLPGVLPQRWAPNHSGIPRASVPPDFFPPPPRALLACRSASAGARLLQAIGAPTPREALLPLQRRQGVDARVK